MRSRKSRINHPRQMLNGENATWVLWKTSKLNNNSAPLCTFQRPFRVLGRDKNPEMDPTQLYGRTTLVLILLAKFGLAGKVIKENGDSIYVVSVHPGAVSNEMALASPKPVEENWNSWDLNDPDKPGKGSSQVSDGSLGSALWKLRYDIIKQKLGSNALLDWEST